MADEEQENRYQDDEDERFLQGFVHVAIVLPLLNFTISRTFAAKSAPMVNCGQINPQTMADKIHEDALTCFVALLNTNPKDSAFGAKFNELVTTASKHSIEFARIWNATFTAAEKQSGKSDMRECIEYVRKSIIEYVRKGHTEDEPARCSIPMRDSGHLYEQPCKPFFLENGFCAD